MIVGGGKLLLRMLATYAMNRTIYDLKADKLQHLACNLHIAEHAQHWQHLDCAYPKLHQIE